MAKDDITAFLGAGTIYNGQLSFVGSVRIDGKFAGEIKSEGTLILGNDAQVEGSIEVSQLILSGNLHGDVLVTGKTILHKTAHLTGNLSTRALIMEDGAFLQGNICMETSQEGLIKPSGMSKAALAETFPREIDIQ
ncbi:membrane protein [Deltaproteobacteria bacterium]|nr:membrane protein [Deltaproteobacteria bacterium]